MNHEVCSLAIMKVTSFRTDFLHLPSSTSAFSPSPKRKKRQWASS